MDKTDPPVSFGVFKPVGHTVIAYRSEAEVDVAAAALREQGFVGVALVRYTAAEMLAQADAELAQASPLAGLGQDLNLVRAQRELAARGCGFLVVHAPDDERAARVDTVLRASHAVAAQRYGRLIVEECVEPPQAAAQVFESPDRGLDLPAPAR
jgi:hypothetical protein